MANTANGKGKKKSSAAAKGKNSGTSAKKTTARAKKTYSKEIKYEYNMTPIKEALLVVFIAVSLFIFVCNFGVCGKVGEVISSVNFGLFGYLCYAFPIYLVLLVLFFIANKQNFWAIVKAVLSIVLVIGLCFFIALCFEGKNPDSVANVWFDGYNMKKGCGVVGGALVTFFVPRIGLFGSYLLSIILIIIAFLIIFERLVAVVVDNFSRRDYDDDPYEVREKVRIRTDELPFGDPTERAEDRHRLFRRDKIVSGVAYDTEINKKARKSDEMAELTSDITFEEAPVIANESKPKRTVRKKEPVLDKEPVKEDTLIEASKAVHIDNDSVNSNYVFPSIELLKRSANKGNNNTAFLEETKNKLEQTLKSFGVDVTVTDVTCGPSVTRYEITPNTGVKVNKIVALADDIKLNLAAADIRIEAPIPGKSAVGIEVPNKENKEVRLRDLLESYEYKSIKTKIPFTAGLDIAGKPIIADIAKMPHVLIAGSTGSGKSVCINTIVMSILYKARPDEVKLIMVDPKVVELSVYNDIPHLLIPVVTDPKKAAAALAWAVSEMTERYKKFAEESVRDLAGYNESIMFKAKEDPEELKKKLPQIVIIVDELADLMMVAPGDVEEAICRLAQLARAAGIHLVLATQRPSVNVITGLIKANMPSRVAFAVSSGVDSRTILDMNGAEKLLGKGDMLFYPQGYQKPLRVQGAFVTDEEVSAVCDAVRNNNKHAVEESKNIEEEIKKKVLSSETMAPGLGASTEDGRDVYFGDAGRFIIEKERASIGLLQRQFKIGFNRAARIMDQLEEAGVVGPEEGTKPRRILLSLSEFNDMIDEEGNEA
ncbi:MAG: DNA translocase FtsK 4TM domain-containing protein [Lachnospiraceae bacterium]|nr:DNA translocase FtsK 4TM domain-containing protein [Lachnospiraceae bacterium]